MSNESDSAISILNRQERLNWIIHYLFQRKDYEECQKEIELASVLYNKSSEYSLFVQALLKRYRGKIQESLLTFKDCHLLNPQTVKFTLEVGKSLILMGKPSTAQDILLSAIEIDSKNPEILNNIGECHSIKREFKEAEDYFLKSLEIKKKIQTYYALANVQTEMEAYHKAINTYFEALEFSPDNPDIFTKLGLLYIRAGDHVNAFQQLGSALAQNPRNSEAILGAGSIIQDRGDTEAALQKYRLGAQLNSNSPHLWNNIGMCFFAKQKFVAAISCLKRAQYLDPLEWISFYNLGLVHLHTQQLASAFMYFNTAMNLKPDYAGTYLYLGVVLSKMGDIDNSIVAFEKAIQMEKDHVFVLNYAVCLFQMGKVDEAKEKFIESEKLFQELDEETKSSIQEVLDIRNNLSAELNIQI